MLNKNLHTDVITLYTVLYQKASSRKNLRKMTLTDKEKIERALRFLKEFEAYADSLATTTVILSNAMPSFKRYFQNIKKTLED